MTLPYLQTIMIAEVQYTELPAGPYLIKHAAEYKKTLSLVHNFYLKELYKSKKRRKRSEENEETTC